MKVTKLELLFSEKSLSSELFCKHSLLPFLLQTEKTHKFHLIIAHMIKDVIISAGDEEKVDSRLNVKFQKTHSCTALWITVDFPGIITAAES